MKTLEILLLHRAERYTTSGEQIGLEGKKGVIPYAFYGLRRSKLEEAIKLAKEKRDANPPTITSSEEEKLKLAERCLKASDDVTRSANETDAEAFAFVLSYLLSGAGKNSQRKMRAFLQTKALTRG